MCAVSGLHRREELLLPSLRGFLQNQTVSVNFSRSGQQPHDVEHSAYWSNLEANCEEISWYRGIYVYVCKRLLNIFMLFWKLTIIEWNYSNLFIIIS